MGENVVRLCVCVFWGMSCVW